MATNDMGTTSRGIQYPTAPTQFASGDWWKRLADSVNTAIGESIKNVDAWLKSAVPAGTDLNGLTTPGTYSYSQSLAVSNSPFPADTSVAIEVIPVGISWLMQRATDPKGVTKVRIRAGLSSSFWQPWQNAGFVGVYLDPNTNLNDVAAPGAYSYSQSLNIAGSPFPANVSATVEVMNLGRDWVMQRATSADGDVKVRVRTGSSSVFWSDWRSIGGGAVTLTGGLTHTSAEVTGTWESTQGIMDACQSLSKHDGVKLEWIGKSAGGSDIPALVIGDPSKPCFLALAGQHGLEQGNPHGLIRWVRQLIDAPTEILVDMCILVVPLLNMDNYGKARGNSNGVDLNRDWADFTQPETKAVRDWIASKNVIAAVDGHSFGYPRQVSLKPSETATGQVAARSGALYDHITASVKADGNPVRRYDPAGTAGTFINGIASLGVPAVTLEVPSVNPDSTSTEPRPSVGWQVRISAVCYDSAAHLAWTWTPTYPADMLTA